MTTSTTRASEGHKVPVQRATGQRKKAGKRLWARRECPMRPSLAMDPEALLKAAEKLRAELDKAKHEAHEYKDATSGSTPRRRTLKSG